MSPEPQVSGLERSPPRSTHSSGHRRYLASAAATAPVRLLRFILTKSLSLVLRRNSSSSSIHRLKRSKKAVTIRGLNKNHNHDLKNIFKGAAARAAAAAGPFQKFYEARIASGLKPPMARLTLARKIAAITLLVWKKGVRFDAEQLKQQAA